jgi:predicted nucleic-acid-binding protein
MIGLDTNVIVRFLVIDDPEQAKKASTLVRTAIKNNQPLFIDSIVLCELVWVLEGAYSFSKEEISDVLEKILMTEQIIIQDRDEAWLALDDYRSGAADFSDYYIGRINKTSGCNSTATFDQALKGNDLFRLL